METSPATTTKSRSSAVATHVALVVVQLAFASGAVEGKLAMASLDAGGGGVSPEALAMARMSGATIFFHGVASALGIREKTTWRDQAQLAGLAVLGIVLNQGLYLVGLRITSAFSAALLGATIPVFTAALAVMFRQERASARTALGLALALVGVVWLIGVRAVDPGAIVIALNCLSYSFYLVLSRGLIRKLGAMTLITWAFTWGVALFAPVGAIAFARECVEWNARSWSLVAYVVAMPTIVAYLANAWALGRSNPTLVTIYIYLQPLIAAVLVWLQFGQGLSARMIVAAALILAGVGVVATRKTSTPAPATGART